MIDLKKIASRKAASFLEHGFLTGFIAVVAISGITQFSEKSRSSYNQVDMTIPSCMNPKFVGTIGRKSMPECAGMLIVDNTMLRAHASLNTGGDRTFQIETESGTFTFEDDERNVYTGQVTDMSYLFANSPFNGDIGYWDTSNVTDLHGTFYRAVNFEHDISRWNVSLVTDMRATFFHASNFNHDISKWDTSSVKYFYSFLEGASTFYQDLSEWDVSKVLNSDNFANDTPMPPEYIPTF